MGMVKNYLLKVLQQCSEEKFGQDAVEWAIGSGLVGLSYDLDRDVRAIMTRYDDIIEAYRRVTAQALRAHPGAQAPMQRATPGRRLKASSSDSSKRRKVA